MKISVTYDVPGDIDAAVALGEQVIAAAECVCTAAGASLCEVDSRGDADYAAEMADKRKRYGL